METSRHGMHSSAMTLGDHLDELRRRLVWCILAPLPIAIAAFMWAEPIRNMLCEPVMAALVANDLPAQLQVLSPVETLTTDLKLAFVTAIVLGAPWILVQVWIFVKPGLFAHEKRFVRLLVPMSMVLTLAGLALLYFVLMPMMLNILVSLGSEPPQRLPIGSSVASIDGPQLPMLPTLSEPPSNPVVGQMWLTPDNRIAVVVPMDATSVEVLSMPLLHGSRLAQQFRLSEYLDFVLDFALGTAVAFQTPIAVLLLGWIGVITPETLGRFRRYAVFFAAVIAAIVTPSGDLFSLALLAVPIYLLYELGILMLRIAPPSAVAQGRVFGRLLRMVESDKA